MRIFIDTNILISAALNPEGTPAKAFIKAVVFPNKGMISDQVVEELRRIFNKKFPDKLLVLERFLSMALSELELVTTPLEEKNVEKSIRDVKDWPILRAAMHGEADIMITGDKDFLEAEIEGIQIMTAAVFLEKIY